MSVLMRAWDRWQDRWRAGAGPVCLMLHRVREADVNAIGPDHGLSLPVASFATLMEEIARRFEPISMDTVADALARRRPLPREAVVLTFDDGYRDNLDMAWPILERHRLPVTFYLTTGFIEGTCEPYEFAIAGAVEMRHRIAWSWRGEEQVWELADHASRLACYRWIIARMKSMDTAQRRACLDHLHVDRRTGAMPTMMNWPDVRALAADPLVTIGAHTHEHLRLTTIDAHRAGCELQRSKERIELEIGQPVRHLSYPYGSVNAEVAALARQAGYQTAVTTRSRCIDMQRDDPLLLPRIDVLTWSRTSSLVQAA